MKIIAREGERYLICELELDKVGLETKARVVDLNSELIYPEQNVNAILVRGRWIEYQGKQSKLSTLVELVDEVEGGNIYI